MALHPRVFPKQDSIAPSGNRWCRNSLVSRGGIMNEITGRSSWTATTGSKKTKRSISFSI